MQRVLVATAIGIAALVGLGAAVLYRGGSGRPRPGSRLRVLFTGEAMGELEPCNCSGKEAGGLPALGGFLATQEGEHLLVDVGCLGRGARDFEILRLQAVLRGMAMMGYDAVNVGEYELWLGRENLAKQLGLGVPFTSANVTDNDGEPVARPFLVVRRAGLSVAITGLVASEGYLTGPGLRVDDPREALARVLPPMREQASVVVVLADLDVEAVRELVRDFPEITLALFRGRGDSRPPERINRSVIASVSGKARFVGDVTLSWDDDLALTGSGVPVELDERFPPDAAVAEASIGWYKRAIEGRRFDVTQPRPGWRRLAASRGAAGDTYAGSAACRACHKASWEAWEKSKHRQALDTLAEAAYQWSPECIVCHVVGYGAADGYVARRETPNLADVGCESCHGRGGRHVGTQGKALGSIVRGGQRSCRPCHTPEHSRGFVFDDAWAKIAHKEKP